LCQLPFGQAAAKRTFRFRARMIVSGASREPWYWNGRSGGSAWQTEALSAGAVTHQRPDLSDIVGGADRRFDPPVRARR